MDTKDIKASLKAAREAIRTKDYKEALKQCKDILKSDKNNYNALVFVGVAAEGLGEAQQAVNAYKKAIDVNPENLLAWQGLCSFYEKSDTRGHKDDLVNVYKQLKTLYASRDEAKCLDVRQKLAMLFLELGHHHDAIDTAQNLVHEVTEGSLRSKVMRTLVSALESVTVLTDQQENQLLSCYEELTAKADSDGEGASSDPEGPKLWNNYLRVLRKRCQDSAKLHEVATSCHRLQANAVLPLEILAQLLLDQSVGRRQGGSTDGTGSEPSLDQILDSFEASGPNNAFKHLLIGLKEFHICKYDEARKHLKIGLEKIKTNTSGWTFLARSLLETHKYSDAYRAAKTGLESLERSKMFYGSDSTAKFLLKFCVAKASFGLGDQFLSEGRRTVEELKILAAEAEQASHDDVLVLEVDICLRLGETEDAEKLFEKFSAELKESARGHVCQGRISEAKDKLQEALKSYSLALQKDDKFPLANFYLGRLKYNLSVGGSSVINRGELINHLLKSAKLDPFYAPSFFYLGKFYENITRDQSKATKCYQKSYELNPSDNAAGCALCDILMATGKQEEVLMLLKSVTRDTSTGSGRWAWLRLGLYQLSHEDPTSAIVSLQSALRADPRDVHVWECLGEAYMKRGSYTAALKAFTKATELDPSALFCFFQIATIQQTLGLFDEAVDAYKEILKTHSEYVPALKGLGQTLIEMVKVAISNFFDGRAVDYCREAIGYLTLAVSHRPDLSCLWKLLGDACTMLYPLAENNVRMMIPRKLTQTTGRSEGDVEVQKLELLQTGARCYGMALKLHSDMSSLWHDLGLNYFHQSQMVAGVIAREKSLLARSVQCLQKAVRLDPNDTKHWDSLGALAAKAKDFSLAQHCFIRAVKADPKNVSAWSNLGGLYLVAGHVRPAHEAFKVAQSLEPSRLAAWVGQAMIAESLGDADEATDLFRHTTELGNNTEGALGYAHWVCSLLLQGPEERQQDPGKKWNAALFDYAIREMGAVPAACDAISRYTRRQTDDVIGYNLHGLLLEQQGLYRSAAGVLGTAVKLASRQSNQSARCLDTVRENYARVLLHSGRHAESLEVYQHLGASPGNHKLRVLLGLALAQFEQGNYDESVATYDLALDDGECPDALKSHIHAAMGMAYYKNGDLLRAKSTLLEGFRLPAPSVAGLQSLLALGLLQRDSELAGAVVNELTSKVDHNNNPEISSWIQDMEAHVTRINQSQGNGQSQRDASLKMAVIFRPDHAQLWRRLAECLTEEGNHRRDNRYSAALMCLLAESCLSSQQKQGKKCAVTKPVGRSSTELLHAIASLGAGHHVTKTGTRSALSLAQKAVLVAPDKLESWFTLLAAAQAQMEISSGAMTGGKGREELASVVTRLTTHLMARVESQLSQASGDKSPRLQALHLWAVKQYILSLTGSGRQQQAQQFLEQAVWLYDNDSLLKTLTALFSENFAVLKTLTGSDTSGSLAYQVLIGLYCQHGLTQEAKKTYHSWLQNVLSREERFNCLASFAYFVAQNLLSGKGDASWNDLFKELTSDMLKSSKCSVLANLLLGIVSLHDTKGTNFGKRSLSRVIDHKDKYSLPYAASVARQLLINLYKEKGDLEAVDKLLGK